MILQCRKAGIPVSNRNFFWRADRIFGRRMHFAALAMAAALYLAPPGPATASEPLPDWQGVRLEAWTYKNRFFPSSWPEGKLGAYDWTAGNAVVSGGNLLLSVTERGSAQVQTSAPPTAGFWEVDVTLPDMVPGLVAAPLWLMSADTEADEIDFEFIGTKGLTITAWARVEGAKRKVWERGVDDPIIPGDLSGRRFRLGLAYQPNGFIEWYIDGTLAARITPADTDGKFPTLPMRPYFDLWVAKGTDPRWAGNWTPMQDGRKLTMSLGGYRYSADGPSPQPN
jgi:hypothetical protein